MISRPPPPPPPLAPPPVTFGRSRRWRGWSRRRKLVFGGIAVFVVLAVMSALGAPKQSAIPGATPVAFSVIEPKDRSSVASSPLLVRGTAPAFRTVSGGLRGGDDVTVSADAHGNWAMSVNLEEGPNELQFRIDADPTTARSLSVTFTGVAVVGDEPTSAVSTPGATETELSSPGPRPTVTGFVSEQEYGAAWPFTVPDGVVRCVPYQAVVFDASNGQRYALNGFAKQRFPKLPPLEEIWAFDPNPDLAAQGYRISIGGLIELGLTLC
jgi:Protein of unknown function (DUF2511)